MNDDDHIVVSEKQDGNFCNTSGFGCAVFAWGKNQSGSIGTKLKAES
jgi:hypothetical protein